MAVFSKCMLIPASFNTSNLTTNPSHSLFHLLMLLWNPGNPSWSSRRVLPHTNPSTCCSNSSRGLLTPGTDSEGLWCPTRVPQDMPSSLALLWHKPPLDFFPFTSRTRHGHFTRGTFWWLLLLQSLLIASCSLEFFIKLHLPESLTYPSLHSLQGNL